MRNLILSGLIVLFVGGCGNNSSTPTPAPAPADTVITTPLDSTSLDLGKNKETKEEKEKKEKKDEKNKS